MMALTGFAYQHCTFDVRQLDCIGKVREQDTITFPVKTSDKKLAVEEAKKYTPEGWVAYTSYNSQDSFKYVAEEIGNSYIAKTQIVRWVDKK